MDDVMHSTFKMAVPRKAEKPEYIGFFRGLTPVCGVLCCHARNSTVDIPSTPKFGDCAAQNSKEEPTSVRCPCQDECTPPSTQDALQRAAAPREEESDQTVSATDSLCACGNSVETGIVYPQP